MTVAFAHATVADADVSDRRGTEALVDYEAVAARRLDGMVRLSRSAIRVVEVQSPDVRSYAYGAGSRDVLAPHQVAVLRRSLRAAWRPRLGLFDFDGLREFSDVVVVLDLQRRFAVFEPTEWRSIESLVLRRASRHLGQALRSRRADADSVVGSMLALEALNSVGDVFVRLSLDTGDAVLRRFRSGDPLSDAAVLSFLPASAVAATGCASVRCRRAVRVGRRLYRQLVAREVLEDIEIAQLLRMRPLADRGAAIGDSVREAAYRGLAGHYPVRDLEVDPYPIWWFSRILSGSKLPPAIVASLSRQMAWGAGLSSTGSLPAVRRYFIDTRSAGAGVGAVLWPERGPWILAGWRSRGAQMWFTATRPPRPLSLARSALPAAAIAVYVRGGTCAQLPSGTERWLRRAEEADLTGLELPTLAMVTVALERCGHAARVRDVRDRLQRAVPVRLLRSNGGVDTAWLSGSADCVLRGRVSDNLQGYVVRHNREWRRALLSGPLTIQEVWMSIWLLHAVRDGCAWSTDLS